MSLRRWILVGFGACASACGDARAGPGPDPNDRTVHAVLVSPDHAAVAVDARLPLAASVDAGLAVQDRSVAWTSSRGVVLEFRP